MKFSKITAVLLCLVVFSSSLGAGSAAATSSATEEISKQQEIIRQLERFLEVYSYLEEYHVDNPSATELMDDAIEGMLFFMGDPYTTYMKKEEYQNFINSVNGAFVGIGIYASLTEEGVAIQGVIPGGAAAKAGLQVGDIIREVNGEVIEGQSVEEATELILGEEGTEVEITIGRMVDGEEQTLVYQLSRGKIQLPHVELKMLDPNTAHLKLYRFGAETYDIIKRELGRIQERGVDNLILDLRGNSGGMMDSVIEIASLFKESGVIFHTKDNTGKLTSYEIDKGNTWEIPMVVLIDYYTASAAEVLAGFLQDYELAKVVGEDSFGKGRIQTSIELEHGGVLHISIEEYFTPEMKQVDFEGIHPDVYVLDPDLQVAKAYGLLKGIDEVVLQHDGELKFNRLTDANFKQYAFKEEDTWYLSARMLSDWYGGRIEWDWETEQIHLELFNQVYTMEKNHPQLRMQDEKAYLELDYLLEQMPVEMTIEEDRLVLQRETE